jgi:hypothetical protein
MWECYWLWSPTIWAQIREYPIVDCVTEQGDGHGSSLRQPLTVYSDNGWTGLPRKTAVVDHVSTFGLVKSFIIVISW